jgi:hypothetical protein
LVKFSQHLDFENEQHRRILDAWKWNEMSEHEQSLKKIEAGQYPRGDAARMIERLDLYFFYLQSRETHEAAISHMLEMWMYGASDHFYDLYFDRAPWQLRRLASLAMAIGRPWGKDPNFCFGKEHYDELFELWKEATVAVDQQFSGRDVHWGEW